MITVIKRSGKEELFDRAKLKKTITAAGEEIRKPLNESDINNLTNDVVLRLSDQEKVTSKEVYNALIACMHASGFDRLADAYAHFADNAWL